MKKLIVLIFSIFLFGSCEEKITLLTDENFEKTLIDYGYDDVIDGKILTSNIENIDSLEIKDRKGEIKSLVGISDFSGLKYFKFRGDLLKLDLSHNSELNSLDISSPLEILDLSQNKSLKFLKFFGENLKSLTLPQSDILQKVWLSNCHKINNLNFDYNVNLNELEIDMGGKNCKLKYLTLNKNTALKKLGLWNIQRNKKNFYIDISKNSELEEIILYDIYKLRQVVDDEKGKQGCLKFDLNPNLKKLILRGTRLNELNISENQNLTYISIFDTHLEKLNISNNPNLDIDSVIYDNEFTTIEETLKVDEIDYSDDMYYRLSEEGYSEEDIQKILAGAPESDFEPMTEEMR